MESNCRDFWRGGGAPLPPPPPLSPPPPPPTPHAPFLHPFCTPPPFPPSRRQRNRLTNGSSSNVPWWKAWMKKYVVLCLVCGGLSVVLGIVLIVIYLLLRSYTSSLQFFETIPTYVPGVVLIITGLIVLCFAKRKNRYAYLMKIAGGCCLICALLCVVITVTTTVVHMNRLQTLHECVYTPQAKTCMCVSAIADHHNSQDAHRFVFNNTPNCEVVHGSLYACLRALFSFSVIGILVCIFSSMLVYQLLSHEKKRIYWEQLELRRRFLYQRHSHHAVCGCYDDIYPWQLWEMLDYRVLASHSLLPDRCPALGDDELLQQQQQSMPAVRGNGLGGGGHRASGWNWLPWPRQNTTQRNNSNNRSSENPPTQQNFMRRLMSRDGWNQQLVTSGNSPPEESSLQPDSNGPWRSECIHIFRPSPRSGNCVPPVRFGIRSRNSPYGRHHVGHRRTRSNDGVFHHLHMNSAPRYSRHYPLPDGNGGLPCHFSNFEFPRYMWGPPPPYSQPPSIENIPAYNNNNTHNSRRPASGRSIEISHCDQMISALEPTGTGSVSSKMSTPLSERRYLCHNFSSDGITLTIGSNFPDLHSQNRINSETKRDETCIVEVHVPYILHKNDIVFNTLPTRSCRKKDINPFKSLSNIPLGLSRKFSSLKSEKHDSLSMIETCCELSEDINCPVDQVNETNVVQSSIVNNKTHKAISEQQLYDEHTVSVSPVTETSPNSPVYQPTTVAVPLNFRSSLMIATSPSTPVTENVTLKDTVYAQSMPNLNISNSPLICHIRRVPSSGNTSTSQDFGDFELDEDSSPLVLCSPVSDIQADDNISETSWVYPKCPRRFRNKDPKVPFFSDSSSDSCDVTVSGTDHRCLSPTVSHNSTTSNDVLIDSVEQDHHKVEIVHKPHSPSHKRRSIVPLSSSIIISNRPSINCSINCNIHHLHHYYPVRRNVREVPENVRDSNLQTLSGERSNDFIVTIKSINV